MSARPPPARLLVVLDRPTCDQIGRPAIRLGRDLAEAGARFVWYRHHRAGAASLLVDVAALAPLLAGLNGALVVGDRLDVALLGGASGVHLPSHGLPVSAARRFVDLRLVGRSCHSLEEVVEMAAARISYATLSPIFATTSAKQRARQPLGPAALEQACQAAALPLFALGGITPERTAECLDAGAWGVAVLGGIVLASDPVAALHDYLEAIEAWEGRQ